MVDGFPWSFSMWEALVGMSLLSGHELRIEVEPGGAVEITTRP
jgi:hypothetical protein